jgi:hypothetical protein
MTVPTRAVDFPRCAAGTTYRSAAYERTPRRAQIHRPAIAPCRPPCDGGVLDEVRNLVAGVETPSLRRDRQFESISLQRRVSKLSVPAGKAWLGAGERGSRSALRRSLARYRRKWDREFESGLLQQRVRCKPDLGANSIIHDVLQDGTFASRPDLHLDRCGFA